jgi:hypothetical protein
MEQQKNRGTMNAYSELISDLAELAETRTLERQTAAANAQMDRLIAEQAPAIDIARAEAIRNRMAPARVWAGRVK